MAFSAGTYTLPGAALNTGDTVSATENNTLRNDMATAFNKTWLRDGTAAATANIPLGNNELTGAAAIGSATSLALKSNNGITAVTIDTSQNVGIGTSSPNSILDVVGSGNPTLTLRGSAGGYTGIFNIQGAGGGGSVVSATGGTNSLAFNTNGSEKARIDSSGNLLVGTTTASVSGGGGYLRAPNAGGSSSILLGHINGTATGNSFAEFWYNTGSIGGITQNGTTGVLYNLTSDYRLKNNPEALTGAKDFVMALQPKKWQWWDGSGEGVGFIAHEFMEVAKYSGHGEKDAVDEDGKPVYQSIQPSSSEVMANLVSLIQEQQAIIQAQAADIAALKEKVGL